MNYWTSPACPGFPTLPLYHFIVPLSYYGKIRDVTKKVIEVISKLNFYLGYPGHSTEQYIVAPPLNIVRCVGSSAFLAQWPLEESLAGSHAGWGKSMNSTTRTEKGRPFNISICSCFFNNFLVQNKFLDCAFNACMLRELVYF